MIKFLFFLFCFTPTTPTIAMSYDQSDEVELSELNDYIAIVSGQPPENINFEKVITNLSILSQPYRFSSPDRYLIYEKYQDIITNKPGYALMISSRLTKLYDDRLSAPTHSREYNEITSNLQLEASNIYMALKSLPTKETVLALADFYEYSKFDPRPIGDLHQPAETIPMLAGKILNELPIKNRPTPRIDPILSHGSEILNMVEKWRVWCKDVKAGKIEPEFGPEVFRDGSSIPPIAARHQTRPPKPMPTKIQSTVTQSAHTESSSWLWVTGSVAILTGYAVWRMKKVAK